MPKPETPDTAAGGLKKILARLLGLAVFAGALGLAVYLLSDSARFPRTDDASVQAYYISLAAEVPGRIAQLPARDGLVVQPGDLLVRIDPASYLLAVAQAKAQVAALEAQIVEAGRRREAAQAAAQAARDQTQSAQARHTLAQSTYERMGPLAEQGFVTQERYDGAAAQNAEARAGLSSARSSALAAELAVPSLAALEAELQAARAALAQAELELSRTQIAAPFPAVVVNCNTAPGAMAMPGMPLFTLIDTRQWFVVANYREGDLKNIRPGDRALLRLHTLPEREFQGTVVSVGHAVQTADAFDFGPLPAVRRQLDWVRLAQRFPVRIRIDDPEPADALRVGASANVVIQAR